MTTEDSDHQATDTTPDAAADTPSTVADQGLADQGDHVQAADTDAVADATATPDAPDADATGQPGAAPDLDNSQNLSPEIVDEVRRLREQMAAEGYDEKGLRGILSLANKHARSANEAQKQLQALQQQIQHQQEEAQKAADLAKLKPFNAKHPEHGRFQSLLQRARDDELRLASIDRSTEEGQQQYAILARALQAAWKPEEVQSLQDYQAHLESQKHAVLSNPEDYLISLMDRYLPAQFQRMMQAHQAYDQSISASNAFMTENKELIAKHGKDLVGLMEEGLGHGRAMELVKLRDEVSALKAQLGQSAEDSARARAQTAHTDSRASVTRDGKTTEMAVDPVSEGRKQGLTGEQLNAHIIREHRERMRRGA